jgi:hypothetical protein
MPIGDSALSTAFSTQVMPQCILHSPIHFAPRELIGEIARDCGLFRVLGGSEESLFANCRNRIRLVTISNASVKRNYPELLVQGQCQLRDVLTGRIIDGNEVGCDRGRNHRPQRRDA